MAHRFLIILVLVIGALPCKGENCRDLRVQLDLTRKQIEEFTAQQAELDQKYQRYVAADFQSQTDGMLDELSRNSAIKVIYARKRLKQAIEAKQLALVSAQNEYCGKCGGEKMALMEFGAYCSRCPASPSCPTAKKN